MNTEQEKIIQKVADEVRQRLEGEGSGHDWWHIARVWSMAKHIGASEGADIFVVELAALLHGFQAAQLTFGLPRILSGDVATDVFFGSLLPFLLPFVSRAGCRSPNLRKA